MDKIKEYYNSKRVSNSLLKTLTTPRWIKIKRDNPDQEDDDKKHLRVGSALDCLLTDPTRFPSEFKVIDAVRPFGYMGKFVETLPSGLTPQSDYDLYVEAYYAAGYKMRMETVISKFWEDNAAVNYYHNVVSIDKDRLTILSKDEMEIVDKCRELIKANPEALSYFINYDSDIELLHQVPIYFEYDGVECKGLLDGIKIDHNLRTIQPFDLKTTGKDIYEFPQAFVNYGYFRQAAFYTYAVQCPESPVYQLLQEGYQLLNFQFIVVETKPKSVMPALIFDCTDKDIICGINGGFINKKYIKGIDELVKAYKWHVETDKWDLPYDLYMSNSHITLDVFDDLPILNLEDLL